MRFRGFRAMMNLLNPSPASFGFLNRSVFLREPRNKHRTRALFLDLDGNGSCRCDTGIPFLNHMMDQIPHHGLVDLLSGGLGEETAGSDDRKNELAGLAFGKALQQSLQTRKTQSITRKGQMFLPLDEALVEVSLDLSAGPHLDYNLDIPTKMVGTYETRFVQDFFRSVVESSGICLRINQCTGRNSHHIIEATFKAFARALRQAVEVPGAAADKGDVRASKVTRTTRDTLVNVALNLDGIGKCSCDTGENHYLSKLMHGIALHSKIDLAIDVERTNGIFLFQETASAFGSACLQALGDRKGIHRFGYAFGGDGAVLVSLDLSGRPHLGFNLELLDERVGDIDTEVVECFFRSLARTSGMTLHIHQMLPGSSEQLIEAAVEAFGVALGRAVSYDPRRADSVPSSKGVLTRS